MNIVVVAGNITVAGTPATGSARFKAAICDQVRAASKRGILGHAPVGVGRDHRRDRRAVDRQFECIGGRQAVAVCCGDDNFESFPPHTCRRWRSGQPPGGSVDRQPRRKRTATGERRRETQNIARIDIGKRTRHIDVQSGVGEHRRVGNGGLQHRCIIDILDGQADRISLG